MTIDITNDHIPPRANILGIGVSPINIPMALHIINSWIEKGDRNYVCVTGVHGIIESQRDDEIRRIHNEAGLVTPDGMPLVWLSRAQGFHHVERVYGPDLMLALCENMQSKGYRHYFYGSTPEVLNCLSENLLKRYPKLKIVGTYAPPFHIFSEKEALDEIDLINKSEPDIVWVGLSTPKQERWMSRSLSKLNAKVLIGVGAAFDFHAGFKKQAPRWMQRVGLEWFFRLMTEPSRLWKRYLINNPAFVILIISQLLGLKKYPID